MRAARRSELFHLRLPAFAAFKAAMQESPSGRLWRLLRALEKDIGAVIIRGAWNGKVAAGKYAACPLSVLFASPTREVEPTIRASEEALARHGYAPIDFYRAWDARLIGRRELMRMVDRELTRRLLANCRSPRPDASPPPLSKPTLKAPESPPS